MTDKILVGPHPAEVVGYDVKTRTCRVMIPGITDGGLVELLAEIAYPIGDKSWGDKPKNGKYSTEIEIHPKDKVWVQFIGGDWRYPVITGFRCTNNGNSEDWRRWHHKNLEVIGDERVIIRAKRVDINPVVADDDE